MLWLLGKCHKAAACRRIAVFPTESRILREINFNEFRGVKKFMNYPNCTQFLLDKFSEIVASFAAI